MAAMLATSCCTIPDCSEPTSPAVPAYLFFAPRGSLLGLARVFACASNPVRASDVVQAPTPPWTVVCASSEKRSLGALERRRYGWPRGGSGARGRGCWPCSDLSPSQATPGGADATRSDDSRGISTHVAAFTRLGVLTLVPTATRWDAVAHGGSQLRSRRHCACTDETHTRVCGEGFLTPSAMHRWADCARQASLLIGPRACWPCSARTRQIPQHRSALSSARLSRRNREKSGTCTSHARSS